MLIENPIFRREMKAALGSPKNMAIVAAYLIVLGVVLVVLWPKSGVFSEATDSSKMIFAVFLMCNLTLVTLLVPALSSGSITSEREHNTFNLLFTSLLTSGEILRGKLFAGLALILLVQLLSLPILACCALSGGIGLMLLAKVVLVIMLAAVTYGLLGMAVSALCHRTFTALIISYISIAFLAGVTWLPYALLGGIDRLGTLWQFIRSLSPFDAIYYLIFPGRYDLTMLFKTGDSYLTPFVLHLIGMVVIAFFCLLVFCWYVLKTPADGTVYRFIAVALLVLLALIGVVQWFLITMPHLTEALGNPWKIKGACAGVDVFLIIIISNCLSLARKAGASGSASYTGLKMTVKRKLTFPFYLFDPLKRKRPIGFLRNPVYVAEMRSKVFGRPKFIIRSLAACLGISLILLTVTALQSNVTIEVGADNVRWVAILFQIGIVAMLAPVISSGAITDEVNSGTMLMLRITPISALTVVFGKLKAALMYVSVFIISSLPVLYALAYFESPENYWRLGAWFAILALCTVTFVTAGLFCSTIFKTTGAATVASYTFTLAICIGTFAANLPGAFTQSVRNMLLTINPIVAALHITSDNLFTELPPDTWIYNLVILAGLAAFFTLASAYRTYRIFSHQS